MYVCGGKKRTMNGYSQTPQQERIKILQSLMPEVFDEGKTGWMERIQKLEFMTI